MGDSCLYLNLKAGSAETYLNTFPCLNDIIFTARRTHERDPIYKIKGLAKDMLDGVFDDLVEKNVLNGDELLKIGDSASFILNKAENLVENFLEKTDMAGKIFAGHIANSQEQLSLRE